MLVPHETCNDGPRLICRFRGAVLDMDVVLPRAVFEVCHLSIQLPKFRAPVGLEAVQLVHVIQASLAHVCPVDAWLESQN